MREARQSARIWQRKSAHGRNFSLAPSSGSGDSWISSDNKCHHGLEAVKDLVTSWLPVALPGGIGSQKWWPLFPQGSMGNKITAFNETRLTSSRWWRSGDFVPFWPNMMSLGYGIWPEKCKLQVQISSLYLASPTSTCNIDRYISKQEVNVYTEFFVTSGETS